MKIQMNKDFPRMLTLLRKERKLSQKSVASALGVTQALLSHYENGKRECGLDFLVRAADYYGVSVDYLLGRTSSGSGARISLDELPDSTVSEKFEGAIKDAPVIFLKKLLTNSLEIVFALLLKAKNSELTSSVGNYLQTAVYRAYRMVYSAGGKNDENCFAIPAEDLPEAVTAELLLCDMKSRAAAKSGSADEKITSARIESEFNIRSTALFSVINSAEKNIGKLRGK